MYFIHTIYMYNFIQQVIIIQSYVYQIHVIIATSVYTRSMYTRYKYNYILLSMTQGIKMPTSKPSPLMQKTATASIEFNVSILSDLSWRVLFSSPINQVWNLVTPYKHSTWLHVHTVWQYWPLTVFSQKIYMYMYIRTVNL